jgi:hypothetical protein
MKPRAAVEVKKIILNAHPSASMRAPGTIKITRQKKPFEKKLALPMKQTVGLAQHPPKA